MPTLCVGRGARLPDYPDVMSRIAETAGASPADPEDLLRRPGQVEEARIARHQLLTLERRGVVERVARRLYRLADAEPTESYSRAIACARVEPSSSPGGSEPVASWVRSRSGERPTRDESGQMGGERAVERGRILTVLDVVVRRNGASTTDENAQGSGEFWSWQRDGSSPGARVDNVLELLIGRLRTGGVRRTKSAPRSGPNDVTSPGGRGPLATSAATRVTTYRWTRVASSPGDQPHRVRRLGSEAADRASASGCVRAERAASKVDPRPLAAACAMNRSAPPLVPWSSADVLLRPRARRDWCGSAGLGRTSGVLLQGLRRRSHRARTGPARSYGSRRPPSRIGVSATRDRGSARGL